MTVQLKSFTTAELNVHGCFPESSLRPFGQQALAAVHFYWVVTNFGRRRRLPVAKVAIIFKLGAMIETTVVNEVVDYFVRVAWPQHPS